MFASTNELTVWQSVIKEQPNSAKKVKAALA
jgi:hypothetical protein